MVKRLFQQFHLIIALLLIASAFGSLLVKAYQLTETTLTEEENQTLRSERFANLGHGEAPAVEDLSKPLDEVIQQYNDSMKCLSDSAMKEHMKSTEQQVKQLRGSGGVKKQFEPFDLPQSSPCSDSLKKMMASQEQLGSLTSALSEGKNGAQTQANLPGSTNQTVLTAENRKTQLGLLMQERMQTPHVLTRFCEERECPQTQADAGSWLMPVAVAAAGVMDTRAFNDFYENEQAAHNEAMRNAERTSKRMQEELAAHDQFNHLSQMVDLLMAKQQEINAKAEVLKQAALQLELKMDQGGTSHNCSAVIAQLETKGLISSVSANLCDNA